MKRLYSPALTAAALIALSGCANTPAASGAAASPSPVAALTTFTAADLKAATAEAVAGGDTEGAACFTYLSSQLATLQSQIAAGTAPVGAASAFEAGNIALNNASSLTSSAAKIALETACGPLVQHVTSQALSVGAQSAGMLATLGIKIAVPGTALLP